MTGTKAFALALTALLLLGVSARAAAEGVQRTIWVDAAWIDLDQEETLAWLLEQPAQRLVVVCFSGGQTLFPTQDKFFPQLPRYRGSNQDALAVLLARAHQRGKT